VAGALASVPELEMLQLNNNDLGDAGGRAVASSLASVPKLELLELQANDLGAAAEAAVLAAWAAHKAPLPDGWTRPEDLGLEL